MTNQEIGERISIARAKAGLNKKELAQKIKVADSTIKRYEDGVISKIKMPIIESIAYATAVNPMWIIGKSNDMEWPELVYKQKVSHKQYVQKWNIQYYEDKMLESFIQLEDTNKKKAISYVDNLLKIQKLDRQQAAILSAAAHERTDIEVTEEMRKHDDNIMNDDSEWE